MGKGLGGFLTGILGSENKSTAKGRNVDAGSYLYGQNPGAAEHIANANTIAGNQAQTRQGVQANYGQADQDRGMGQQARQGQGQVAQASLARALGQTPSIAQQQAGRDMQAAQSAQASMAGSARGAGALANAQRNAMNNTANAQANISGQAQINTGNERLAAEQSAAQQFGQMRGGDLASQGQSAQQAQAQAGYQDAQRARNDQMQTGYNSLAHQTRVAQLGAGMNYEAQQSANDLGAQGINAGVGGQNASMNQSNGMSLLGMGQAAAGGIASFATAGATPPPGRAHGGPVKMGAPYIVGERGPEVIVPPADGYVLTHEQTKSALPPEVTRTWGTGPNIPGREPGAEQWEAEKRIEGTAAGDRERDARLGSGSSGLAQAIAGFSPGVRDTHDPKRYQTIDEPLVRADRDKSAEVSAREASGLPLSERDDFERDNAEYRLGARRKNDRALSREQSLAAAVGKSGSDMQAAAHGVDTAYHGGGGYVPPQLIPLRALGGPVAGGMPAIVGGGGPEMLVPLNGPGSGPAAASFDTLTNSGGMDPMASLKKHSDFATRFQSNPTAGPMAYGGAREDGGPVKAGTAYLAGEKGPEAVVSEEQRLASIRARDDDAVRRAHAMAADMRAHETPWQTRDREARASLDLGAERGAGRMQDADSGATRQAPGSRFAGARTSGAADVPGPNQDELAAAKYNATDAARIAAATPSNVPGAPIGAATPAAAAGLAHLINAIFGARR